ncbi:RlpA-like double-psi beta-barrel-protein domain-containing protein-containing protein [Xylogone sp. PMI_703]|nr:RlpA-like double-psi beta-barrel-protein domain-containing protein-containing protein [Xylogone sp. PMI_703]
MTTHQLPDWEIPSSNKTKKAGPLHQTSSFLTRPKSKGKAWLSSISFSRVLPAQKRYFGRSRKAFLLILCGVILLVALVLGLGLGLGLKNNSSSQNLPLPSNRATFTGELTYYSPGLGACGITSSDKDAICAVSHIIFDKESVGSDPNANPLCGLKIRITRFNAAVNANRSVDVTVVDRCVGCKATDLDLSISQFTKLADQALGRVVGSWAWLP